MAPKPGPELPLPDPLTELTGRLRRQARRLTGPRQAILRVLAEAGHPLSSKEIHAALPRQSCDVVTVYRSLHLLEEFKAVHRFDLGDGVARFRLLPEGDDGHHHHLVCRGCSRVIELDHCILGELQERLARESGYTALSHRLQFFGVCPACQRVPSASSRTA
jgi:Fur family transcriptional regulator, ferric uptake regulator